MSEMIHFSLQSRSTLSFPFFFLQTQVGGCGTDSGEYIYIFLQLFHHLVGFVGSFITRMEHFIILLQAELV